MEPLYARSVLDRKHKALRQTTVEVMAALAVGSLLWTVSSPSILVSSSGTSGSLSAS